MLKKRLLLAALLTLSALAHATPDSTLVEYLHHTYPGHLEQITVTSDTIQISGTVSPGTSEAWLTEIPLYADSPDPTQSLPETLLTPDPTGHFTITVPRRTTHDRLLARWALLHPTPTGPQLLSHAHSADTVTARWNLPEEHPRNRKGIGGLTAAQPLADLDALGLAAATVNITLISFMRSAPGPGRTPFTHAETTWYTDDRAVAELDRTLSIAAQHHLLVSAIILVPQPASPSPDPDYARLVAHPDTAPGAIFSMPAVNRERGLAAYTAALEFLAQRYGQPPFAHGRIHHWILHNEVNSASTWTNAGEPPETTYVDLLTKSLRAAHLIARQYDPHTKVFVSLDHHWTASPGPHCYPGRRILELLCDFCAAEGDFPWAVAYHPYPQDLSNPRVWEDRQPTFTFDTPKITFRNLEVLAAWMDQPRMLYLGRERRTLHLTEQGLNSRGYTPPALLDQATGLAYAWNKIKRLPAIELFHYHNWVDNRGEGGLQIGLRKYPDDPTDPLGPKPIWHLYQSLETPNEDTATAFAKPLLGLKDWSEILHPLPIPPSSSPHP